MTRAETWASLCNVQAFADAGIKRAEKLDGLRRDVRGHVALERWALSALKGGALFRAC